MRYIYETLMVCTMRHFNSIDEKKYIYDDEYIHDKQILTFNYPLPPTGHRKKILLMCFFVMPEDVQVEKGFAAEWAHQPHSYVHFPNVSADSCQ